MGSYKENLFLKLKVKKCLYGSDKPQQGIAVSRRSILLFQALLSASCETDHIILAFLSSIYSSVKQRAWEGLFQL